LNASQILGPLPCVLHFLNNVFLACCIFKCNMHTIMVKRFRHSILKHYLVFRHLPHMIWSIILIFWQYLALGYIVFLQIVLDNRFVLIILNDASIASLSNLRNLRWPARWPPKRDLFLYERYQWTCCFVWSVFSLQSLIFIY